MNRSEPNLPSNLYTACQSRDLDLIAMQDFALGNGVLMDRAGRAAYQLLREHWPGAKKILCLCGPGNNGGDGYVVARLAKQAGLSVTVVPFFDVQKLKGDAAQAASRMQQAGIGFSDYSADLIHQHDVIVDAIFGTGLERDIGGDIAQAISLANQQKNILSIDIPSGLHADTGRVLGMAVQAELTVSYIGLKRGLFTAWGPDHCGKLYFNDLGVPAGVYDRVPAQCFRLLLQDYKGFLLPRKKNSHKGDYGHLLIIGGNAGMCGAALMAGMAALRVGAGLVTIATHADHAAILNQGQPELMVRAVDNAKQLKSLFDRCSLAIIGPGLGQDQWAQTLFNEVIKQDKLALVDADGLNLLAASKIKHDHWCLTPHPGEAATLLNTSTQSVQEDRFTSVEKIVKQRGGTCVLKGAGSLVYDQSLGMHVCSAGNPGMASGGMGDVLSGIIAGLLAQGLTVAQASRLGVVLHALAGDAVAEQQGMRGMLATDLLLQVRKLLND